MRKRLVMAAVVAIVGVCLVAGTTGAAVIQITPDIAHGGLVTVLGNSNDDHGTTGSKAVDGNTGTPFYSKDSSNSKLWIAFDLGGQYILDHIEMWFYTPNGAGNATLTVGNTTRVLAPADDGTGLRVKGTAGSTTEAMFAGANASMQTFVNVATAVPAQYVDIYSTSGGFTGGFMEIKLYGTAVVADVPEPASMLLVGTGVLGVFGYARRRMIK